MRARLRATLFFIPIAAGTGRVRLPVVGLAIALVCLAAFFSTWVFAADADPLAAYGEARRYFVEHPYLKAPELVTDGVDGPPADVTPPSGDEQRVQQAELDRLVERLYDAAQGGSMRRWALVPARGFAQAGWLTSMFLHFGWLHLLGNLLFLYIVAPLLEDAWGRWRFLAFYVAGGLVANLAQFALAPHAAVAIAGASGAIAACMGAFSVRFATQRVRMAYFVWLLFRIWVGTTMVPAWICGAAWFGFELLDLARGGAHGVATGAHVGGFVLGAIVALGMKAFGFEKQLRTAEEAELDTQHKSDLMQEASIAAARGDYEAAREHVTALLELMPGREDAELLLAELDLKLGNGASRLERALRKLIAKKDDAGLIAALLRLWPSVEPGALSAPFALQLAKYLVALKRPKLEPMLGPLLTQAATAGGRFATEAQTLLGGLSGPDLSLRDEPLGAASAVVFNAGSMGTFSAPVLDEPLTPMPGVAINPVTVVSATARGLTLLGEGEQRTIEFDRISAIHAGVARVDDRRVLFVDLVVRRDPPLALRLSSDDRAVPAMFPAGTPVPQAWRAFIDRLFSVSKARRLHGESLEAFDGTQALDASLARTLRGPFS